jgi:hypothetical protein
MKMPLNLKIVIILFALDILSQLFGFEKCFSYFTPGQFLYKSISVIISIVIIKGFIKKSKFSRQLAIVLTVFYIIAAITSIIKMNSTVRMPVGELNLEILLLSAVIVVEVYILLILFSKKVTIYFRG